MRMNTILWKGRERRDTPALRVIILFGGITPLAKAISKPGSTVQRWLESGFIPPRYQAEILAAAGRDGIDLKPETFVPFVQGEPLGSAA